MRISFIGSGQIAEKFAKHIYNRFKEQQIKNDYYSLKLGGFYCTPASEASRVALPYNCKIYVNLEDMIADNDIIGILCAESHIKQYVKQLAQLKAKDKIFFHMSNKLNCDVLNNGYENTYASLYSLISFNTTVPGKINEFPFVMEGTGNKIQEFATVLNENGFNVSLVSRANAQTFISASKMLEMNLVSALSSANTAIMASTGINLNSYSSLLKYIMGQMIVNRDEYIDKNITKHLNALKVDSYFKAIGRLDMADYTKMNKYACDICTRLSDINNEDKHEIGLVTKKY